MAGLVQVCVEGVDLQALDLMTHDNIIAVVRQGGPRADIDDRAVGGGQDRVGGLAVVVALEAADVEALVHLPAATAHAAERAGHPWLADGADEEPFLPPFLEQSAIGCGKQEGLSLGGNGEEPACAN